MANKTDIVMVNGVQWYTRSERGWQQYYWLGTEKSHEARIFVRRQQRSSWALKTTPTLSWQVYQDNVLVDRYDELDAALKKAFARWKAIS